MKRKPKTLGEALMENMKPLDLMYPTKLSDAEHQAMQRANAEHAPGVAVRMNPWTFRTEYYEVATGKVISSHY